MTTADEGAVGRRRDSHFGRDADADAVRLGSTTILTTCVVVPNPQQRPYVPPHHVQAPQIVDGHGVSHYGAPFTARVVGAMSLAQRLPTLCDYNGSHVFGRDIRRQAVSLGMRPLCWRVER
jgi:hypothetical protein